MEAGSGAGRGLALLCAAQLSGARAALVQSEGLKMRTVVSWEPIVVAFALLCAGTEASCEQRGHGTLNGCTKSLMHV